MIDFIFQGGIDERFTDWDEARNFVIFDTIVNNPRFDDKTKIKLQDVEQNAFEAHANKFLQSEKAEIAQYYTYLKNQFPSVTNDQRFLAIFNAASDVKADESSVDLEDVKIPNDTKLNLAVVGLAGLALFMLFRR
jgi:hypothetical protein